MPALGGHRRAAMGSQVAGAQLEGAGTAQAVLAAALMGDQRAFNEEPGVRTGPADSHTPLGL